MQRGRPQAASYNGRRRSWNRCCRARGSAVVRRRPL